MSKIVFFNSFHNGDLHVSREMVNKIVQKVRGQDPNISFVYSHRNSSNLLADIPNLGFDPQALNRKPNDHANLFTIGDTTYINTWYGQQDYRYMNDYGMTLDCIYAALDDSCKKLWQFSLSDISTDIPSFFPTIDYTKFDIEKSKEWLAAHPEKKVFIANGEALSGQAINFNLTSIIVQLAQKHTDKTFILTNKEHSPALPSNIVYSSDIIKKAHLSDLNENSFISSFCDVIIGRSSGASTFAMTQENLFRRNIKVLYFTNIVPIPPNKFWSHNIFASKVNFSADILCTNEHNPLAVQNIIDTNL